MSESGMEAGMSTKMDDQLVQLFEYTKFHIGMYVTLSATIIAVFGNDNLRDSYEHFLPFLKYSLGFFVLAGVFGGLIGSSIPEYTNFAKFKADRLGLWKAKLIPAGLCIHLEHTTFWIGCLIAAYGMLVS